MGRQYIEQTEDYDEGSVLKKRPFVSPNVTYYKCVGSIEYIQVEEYR